MQNSTWKLAALAGVVGIGFLVVLQTQRGLTRRDVAIDDPAVSEVSTPDRVGQPTPDLGRGVADSEPEPARETPKPVPKHSLAAESPTGSEFGIDVASGQSEPQPATGSSSPTRSANPFAPTSAENHSPSADGPGHAAVRHGSAVPAHNGGLDFRKPAPNTSRATAGTRDDANPFATIPPAAPVKQLRHTAEPKPLPPSGHDTPKTPTEPPAKNPFATTSAAADSQPSAATAGPALLSPGGKQIAETSGKPGPSVKSTPDKVVATSAASPDGHNSVSPQPASAFPKSTSPPSVASPSPKPDAFNPFEPAPQAASKTAATSTKSNSTKSKTKTAARTVPLLTVPSRATPEKSRPSADASSAPSLSAGKPKAPRLIAPSLPASAVEPKHRVARSDDGAASDTSPKPAAPKSIRALVKQPLPPKTPTDRTPSSAASQQSGPADASPSSPKPNPPQRLDIPSEVAPLKTGARDLPSAVGAKAGKVPPESRKPQLQIEKIAPKNAVLGQPMIYHILVKNVGSATAHQVVVKDQIPKGVQLTGTIPRAFLTGRALSWKLGTLKPNEVRKIAVRVVPRTAGEVGSIATVNFVAHVAVRPTVTAPKLSLAIDAPKEIKLGQPVPFHFKVANRGNREARDVFIRDIIPPELNHAAGRDLEYKIGTLPAGKTKDIRLTMKSVKSGNTVNRAVVTAEGGLKVESTATVHIVDRTSLTMTRTGPRTRYVGQTSLYTNRIQNRGAQTLTSIRIVETVPAGMDVVKTTPTARYDRLQRKITWTIEQLAAGKSQDLKVTLRSVSPGTQASIVEATAGGKRTTVRSQTTVSGLAALRIDVPPVTGPVDVGNPVALRVVAANRGSAPATNVHITVTLSEELVVASVRGPVKNKKAATKIDFEPIKSIAPGKQVVLDVILRSVKPGDARVSVRTESDQMRRPLVRDDAVQILDAGQ